MKILHRLNKKASTDKGKKPRKPVSKKRKIFRTTLLLAVIAAFVFAVTANILVVSYASSRCYTDTEAIPYNRVGLVLGTSDSLRNGRSNLYFRYRMEAAAELYHSGKISRILVSGDNHIKSYDEATAMLNALVALGVPDTAIKCDYAGFSTYDSMIRAKKVWGLDNMTIISQHWHNQRALYIARSAGIDAVAFDANDLKSRKLKLKYTVREWFSRTKALWNIIFNKQPHFLGQHEEI